MENKTNNKGYCNNSDTCTESSQVHTTCNSQNSGSTAWKVPALFFGSNNQERTKSEADAVSFKPVDFPAHRLHARFDSSASGVSYGDETCTKLSRINGAINRMSEEQMRKKLAEFHLNTKGVGKVLKKRLKSYYRQHRMIQFNKVLPETERMRYKYLVIIDFEATCSETNENFVHEIIEFPAVLVDVTNHAVCNVFQRFCKPRVNPILTEFCTTLTGISQAQVDKAKDFTEVFSDFQIWLSTHNLGTEHEFAVVTDGPWDMARFFKSQTEISGIEFPEWAKQWINLRKAFTAFYGYGRVNLHQMLQDLDMTFQGRPHCGLDDARNIAAVALQLLQDGCILRINDYLYKESDNNVVQHDSTKESAQSGSLKSLTESPFARGDHSDT